MKTALFTGTFDPFTIGHHSVVTRALPLFDRIVIGVGVNERKQTRLSAQERREAIERLYADDPRVEVVTYTGLTRRCPCLRRWRWRWWRVPRVRRGTCR